MRRILCLELGAWKPLMPDSRGKRGKMWIIDVLDRAWLRKEPLAARPYEIAIECLCMHLAAEAGIRVPDAQLGSWVDTAGKVRRAIIVLNFLRAQPGSARGIRTFTERRGERSFVLDFMPMLTVHRLATASNEIMHHEEFASGAELLEGTFPQYDKKDHSEHTPTMARVALERLERTGAEGLVRDFTRLLFFDAWIGNGDRHQENWGVIFSTHEPPRLAPVYDPAACLGSELQGTSPLLDDARCTSQRLDTYVENCPTGFGDGQNLMKQPELVDEIKTWPEWRANAKGWLAAIDRVRDTEVRPLLAQIPDEWLPPWRKRLITKLLHRRFEWLKGKC